MSPAMASATNYYEWIASRFRPLLGRRVLDIGGGHGPHLEHIVDPSRFVMSLDLSIDCVVEMRRRFAGHSFDAICGDITDERLVEQLATERFDTIVCVNVLEHVDRDEQALAAMAAILQSTGGRLFLLVPAHPFLYGTPDMLAGHFRRYRRRELRRKIAAAGFGSTRVSYFNGFGAIPYGLNSRVFQPRTLSGRVDAQIVVFDRYCVPVLRRLESWVPMPFGQSLIATAQASGG
jgi:SAM-dependent methyltransferase